MADPGSCHAGPGQDKGPQGGASCLRRDGVSICRNRSITDVLYTIFERSMKDILSMEIFAL